MTLPSVEMRTPDPVSLKRVRPADAVTSRPLALITTTDGLTFRKISPTFWAWATPTDAGSATMSKAASSTRIGTGTGSL